MYLLMRQPGADPGFQVREGELKKIAPSGGRRENFWDISREKSRFDTQKSYFFQLRRETRKLLGYFLWKITILRQKSIFFPILEGARAGCVPLPLDPPMWMVAGVIASRFQLRRDKSKNYKTGICCIFAKHTSY